MNNLAPKGLISPVNFLSLTSIQVAHKCRVVYPFHYGGISVPDGIHLWWPNSMFEACGLLLKDVRLTTIEIRASVRKYNSIKLLYIHNCQQLKINRHVIAYIQSLLRKLISCVVVYTIPADAIIPLCKIAYPSTIIAKINQSISCVRSGDDVTIDCRTLWITLQLVV